MAGTHAGGGRRPSAVVRLVQPRLGNVLPLADDLPHNVQWTYAFTPVEGGTKVDETWQVLETSGQRYYDMVETCEYSVDPRAIERQNEVQPPSDGERDPIRASSRHSSRPEAALQAVIVGP